MSHTNGSGTVASVVTPRLTTADMTSAQRSEQMDRTVAQVAELSKQVNTLTRTLNALKVEYAAHLDYYTTEADRCIGNGVHKRIDDLTANVGAEIGAVRKMHGACVALDARRSGTLWTRLRWLLKGR